MLPEAHQGIASKDARSALLVIPSSRVFSCATAAISPFIILCGRYNAITVTVSFLQILGFSKHPGYAMGQMLKLSSCNHSRLTCLLNFLSPCSARKPGCWGRERQSRVNRKIKHFMLSTFKTVLNVL